METGFPNQNLILDPQIASLIKRKACQLARQRGFGASDVPDLEQDLTIELLRKVQHYDPGRGKPATFASRVIESKAATLVRKARTQKRCAGASIVSLNLPVVDAEGGSTELGSLLDHDDGCRHMGHRQTDECQTLQLRMDIVDGNRPLPKQLKELAAVLSYVSTIRAPRSIFLGIEYMTWLHLAMKWWSYSNLAEKILPNCPLRVLPPVSGKTYSIRRSTRKRPIR